MRLEDHGGRRRRCRGGCLVALGRRAAGAARRAPLPPSVTSLIISSSRPVPSVAFLTDSTLSFTVCRYLGSSWTRLLIWEVTSQPMPPSMLAASRTTTITDGVRGSPRWRSRLTSGLKRNVRKSPPPPG